MLGSRIVVFVRKGALAALKCRGLASAHLLSGLRESLRPVANLERAHYSRGRHTAKLERTRQA
jgi:hypothetical protein